MSRQRAPRWAIPDHDNFTAGPASSHPDGGEKLSMAIQKATKASALGSLDAAVIDDASRRQAPTGFRHFLSTSEGFAALQGLWDRPAGCAGAIAQTAGADEPSVPADGCQTAVARPCRHHHRMLGKPSSPLGIHLSAAIRRPRSGSYSDTAIGRRQPQCRHRERTSHGAQARDLVRKRPRRLALCLCAGCAG